MDVEADSFFDNFNENVVVASRVSSKSKEERRKGIKVCKSLNRVFAMCENEGERKEQVSKQRLEKKLKQVFNQQQKRGCSNQRSLKSLESKKGSLERTRDSNMLELKHKFNRLMG